MNKNKIPSIFWKWCTFWSKKGSIIIEDYTKTINNIYTINNRENTFFSINSYVKNTKNRKEENINGLNCYFFDVDLQDNLNLSKIEIIEKILEKNLEYKEKDNKKEKISFDFIVSSKNGIHGYILLDDNIYRDINGNLNIEKYKKDWKEKQKFYENDMGINFDKVIPGRLTQISRIPGSIHKKEGQEKFTMKLLVGENLLNGESTKSIIDKVPILKIIEKIGLKYNKKTLTILQDGRITKGWKINIKENYIKDFTKKIRPQGGPFNFMLNYYNLINGEKISNYNLVYSFFSKHFGIIGKHKKDRNIRINKFISINLLGQNLSQENLKYYLLLQHYSTKNNINDGIVSNSISIDEFKDFIGDSKIKKSTIIKNLKDLSNNSYIDIHTKEKFLVDKIKLIDINLIKEKGVKFNFCIFPKINEINGKIYNTKFFHYFNSKILKLSKNNTLLINLYLYILKELILKKKDSIFITNKKLNSFKINKNPSNRNKILKNFSKELGDFEIKKVKGKGFEVSNLKK